MDVDGFESFRFQKKVPDGDVQERLVCEECGFIHYVNPKIVVGSVATWERKILLCRRAIEPSRGLWTLPAGFLEERETTEEGACREAEEEAEATIEIISLLALYNLPRISQVQIFYKARLLNEDVRAGVESQEVGLFEWDQIPWPELAFPTVHWALGHFKEAGDTDHHSPFTNP